MADFTDASGRVTAWPLQTRTDDTGSEVVGEHFDGKDGATLLGAFTSGIVAPADAFQALQDTGSNMQVRVGSGAVGDLAFIAGTDPLQGVYSVAWPEADTVVTINAADVSNPRYTSVFLVVAHDQFDTGGFSLPRIATVDGTAEASPSPPAYDGSEKAVLRLADVFVDTGVTEITDADITDERVTATVDVDVAADRVATAAIQDDAVTTAKIAANAVDTSEIAAAAVGASQLASDAVTTAKIENAAVTGSKMSGGSVLNFIEIRRDATDSNTNIAGASFTDVVTVTFTKPAAWTSYEIFVEGMAVVESIGGSPTEWRVRAGSNNGPTLSESSFPDEPALLPANERWTGLTGSSQMCAVQVGNNGGATVVRASIMFIAVRES